MEMVVKVIRSIIFQTIYQSMSKTKLAVNMSECENTFITQAVLS